ncbi:hypothetical protein, partial [Clostridium sp. ZBS14]|uniref:hypothetical protein n=1 Tax=Clostridium sp. ZBS14 TaxID=2949970 RepID=UPI002079FE22
YVTPCSGYSLLYRFFVISPIITTVVKQTIEATKYHTANETFVSCNSARLHVITAYTNHACVTISPTRKYILIMPNFLPCT